MHLLLHSTSLDADSTMLEVFERGVDGGFVAVKLKALPLTIAVSQMVRRAGAAAFAIGVASPLFGVPAPSLSTVCVVIVVPTLLYWSVSYVLVIVIVIVIVLMLVPHVSPRV
jgi:uncharacterized membrane protein YjfL (UPF0719 family)